MKSTGPANCARCGSRLGKDAGDCRACGWSTTSTNELVLTAISTGRGLWSKMRSLFSRTSGNVAQELEDARSRLSELESRIVDTSGRQQERSRELAVELAGLSAAVTASIRRLSERKVERDILLEEQKRLARDRHDHAIQQLTERQEMEAGSLVNRVREMSQMIAERAAGEPRSVTRADELVPALMLRPNIRIGRFNEMDLHLPLLNSTSIVVDAPAGSAGLEQMLQSIVAQAFLSAPPGQVAVTVFNPLLTTTLSAFQVQSAIEAKVFSNVDPNAGAFQKSLETHLTHIVTVDQSMAGSYASLADLISATKQQEHQFRLLVVLDGPRQWPSDALESLERIVRQGATRGVSVLLHIDSTLSLTDHQRSMTLDSLTSTLPVLTSRDGAWKLTVPGAAKKTFALTPPEALASAEITRLMGVVGDAVANATLPSIPLTELLVSEPGSSVDGLSVYLGRRGQQPVGFKIGDTNRGLNHVLVGGKSGSGKSNLLMVLIYSIAAQYSPDEVAMFLLDFKEGVEFQRFTDGRQQSLPHARVVSIKSDAEFGVSTLQHFVDEIDRRSELFKGANCQDIGTYRRQTGEPLARWLLLIDEFQVMFDDEHGEAATALLETVARKGRSYGLHMILASQSLSGVRFHNNKKDAILGQFSARIALQVKEPADSIDFLGQGNPAAAQLRYRGEAVLNLGGGSAENQQFVVAHAQDELINQLQSELAMKHPRRYPLHLYQGETSVPLAELFDRDVPMPEQGEIALWLGQHCDVQGQPAQIMLDYRPNDHLVVLGHDLNTAAATLMAAALSAVRLSKEPLTVVVLNGMEARRGRAPSLQGWLAALARAGAHVKTYAHHQFFEFTEACEESARVAQRTVAMIFSGDSGEITKSGTYDDWMASDLPRLGRSGVHLLAHFSDRSSGLIVRTIDSNYRYVLFVDTPVSEIQKISDRFTGVPLPGAGRVVLLDRLNNVEHLKRIAAIAPLSSHDLISGR